MQELAPGTVIDGTYRVVRPVGSGGMGVVYEVEHARLSGRYALKVLLEDQAQHEEALERFRREAEITSSLRHPNIVSVIDFNRPPGGSPYLVMEFLEGENVAERLDRRGILSPGEVVSILSQVASGLAAAHSRGVVHRDLKPQNVLLVPLPGQTGELAKVVDFGISKVRVASARITRETAVMGTPQYMAPEQVLGHFDEIDHRADQFALGSLAFEMLTGRPPFQGDTLDATLYQVAHEPAPPLMIGGVTPGLVQAISRVLDRALQKRPEHRFRDVLEFADALARASQSASMPAVAVVPAAAASPEVAWPRRWLIPVRRRPVIVGTAIGAAAAAMVLLLRRPAPPPRPPIASAPVRPTAVAPPRAVVEPPPVHIDVEGQPPGLAVTMDGEPANLPIVLPRGPQPRRLVFTAPGHAPYETTIDGSRDRTIVLALRRQEPRREPRRHAAVKPVIAPVHPPAAPDAAAPPPRPRLKVGDL